MVRCAICGIYLTPPKREDYRYEEGYEADKEEFDIYEDEEGRTLCPKCYDGII